MEYLNSPMACLGKQQFTSIELVAVVSRKLWRKIELYTWCRDEYGSSDGAGYEKMGVVICPEDSKEDTERKLKLFRGRMSGFVVPTTDGKNARINMLH